MGLSMDLNEIFVFAKVVEAASFTGAAKLLALPKSTVSRKVAQLEERLGAQLLHRTTRKLRLTEIGAAYYQRCARITAEVEQAEQEVLEMQAQPRGRLRITAPVEFTFLGGVAARFLALHPKVEIDIELTGRQVDLIEEGFDLAIRAGRLADSALVARKLGDTSFVLCASPAYLAKHGTPTSVGELAGHQCIVFGGNVRRQSWRLRDASGEVEVPIFGRLATNSLGSALHAALAGFGIAMLPPPVCAPALAAEKLHAILPDVVSLQGAVYAVYPDRRRPSVTVRAFVDFLCREEVILPWTETIDSE